VISVSDTQDETVPAPEEPKKQRGPIWGVLSASFAFVLVGAVIVSMFWPIERFETAPGLATGVSSRLEVDFDEAAELGIDVEEPRDSIKFVTALGSRLTPLQALMGWIDPFVTVETCEERFGDCEPKLQKEIQLGAMATSKEIAAFVAFSYLGLDARLEEGVAQVGSFDEEICPSDAPALRACRVLEVGDTILSVQFPDRSPGLEYDVETVRDLGRVLKTSKVGDRVILEVRGIDSPEDERRTVEVELMASPSDPDRVIVGFNARDTRQVVLPLSVRFDTDRIGGPSAGLAFTLALIDELTPGGLAPPGGVAATGTIAEDGSVGPIGALVQKAIAVERSGADLFLVPAAQPASEVESARLAVEGSLEIVTVATLTEALEVLRERGGSPVQRG
jgi:PDZ domain-containing protein